MKTAKEFLEKEISEKGLQDETGLSERFVIKTLSQDEQDAIFKFAESYAREHAIEFECFLMREANEIEINRESVEYAYDKWQQSREK